MPRVNKFMCHIELFIGCVIIGMINAVLSLIFAVYTILDIYNHNTDERNGMLRMRTRRAPIYDEYSRHESRMFEPFVFFKAVLLIAYLLQFIYCFYLIGSALKKSVRNIQRYLLVSASATIATFCDGSFIVINAGFSEMALNYFAFTVWNIYFLICVYSYFKKYEERSLDDYVEGIETQVIRV